MIFSVMKQPDQIPTESSFDKGQQFSWQVDLIPHVLDVSYWYYIVFFIGLHLKYI